VAQLDGGGSIKDPCLAIVELKGVLGLSLV